MTAAVSGVRAAAFSLDLRTRAPSRTGTRPRSGRAGAPALPGLAPGVLLNVNIPNVSLAQLAASAGPMASTTQCR